jgi:hypothetical protein
MNIYEWNIIEFYRIDLQDIVTLDKYIESRIFKIGIWAHPVSSPNCSNGLSSVNKAE